MTTAVSGRLTFTRDRWLLADLWADQSSLPSIFLAEVIITDVNPSGLNDSTNELDVGTGSRRQSDMVEPKLQVVLQRRDCARNAARFYVLAIEPSLYGDAALVRTWGRIGSLGRQRLDLYASAADAGEALGAWLARKVQRGYSPVTAKV